MRLRKQQKSCRYDFISGGSADRIFPQFEGQDKSAYQVALDSQIVKAFQEACKKHQIMAVPNLYLKPEEGKDNHRAYDASLLMDKDGLIVGIQKMVHVAQAELFMSRIIICRLMMDFMYGIRRLEKLALWYVLIGIIRKVSIQKR